METGLKSSTAAIAAAALFGLTLAAGGPAFAVKTGADAEAKAENPAEPAQAMEKTQDASTSEGRLDPAKANAEEAAETADDAKKSPEEAVDELVENGSTDEDGVQHAEGGPAEPTENWFGCKPDTEEAACEVSEESKERGSVAK